jgi:uroporphyrinogen-III synthase
MSSGHLHILSTRPLGDSVISDARSKGIVIDEMEFIQTRPLSTPELEAKVQSLVHQNIVAVFTSMNAVEAVANMLGIQQPAWRIGCIGQTTQLLVETLLPDSVIIATGSDATDLANNLLPKIDNSDVYFFCSNIRRDELPGILLEGGVPRQEIVVYETMETPHVVQTAYDGVLFFSPSAVRSFFSMNRPAAHAVLFATGKTTAAAIREHCHNEVQVAEAPGKMELVKKLMSWYADKRPA